MISDGAFRGVTKIGCLGFDTNRITQSQSSSNLFRLKPADLPQSQKRLKNGRSSDAAGMSGHSFFSSGDAASAGGGSPSGTRRKSITDDSPGGRRGSVADGSASGSRRKSAIDYNPENPELPLPRSQKYFNLLMKHHNKRIKEEDDKDAEKEVNRRLAKAEDCSRRAAKEARLQAIREEKGSNADSDSDEADDEADGEESDLGELTAYDGAMKIDLEIVVMRVPGEKESSSMGDSRPGSSTTASSKSSESVETPRLDLSAELEALQAEMPEEEEEESDSDDLPDFNAVGSIWDNPNMKWSLGIGGSVFFIPDAERYALAPSLPPPPPPSMFGRRRLRLKPRLPLDISNHRYRDEHPNIWPESNTFSPSNADRTAFEQKLMTMDFYASCNRSFSKLPPLEREKDKLKNEVKFGHIVEQETGIGSMAWRNFRHKEKIKRMKEDELLKAEAEAAAKEDRRASRASLKASKGGAELQTEIGGATPGNISGGASIEVPSESGGPGGGPN